MNLFFVFHMLAAKLMTLFNIHLFIFVVHTRD
jgi:hypothetical protein